MTTAIMQRKAYQANFLRLFFAANKKTPLKMRNEFFIEIKDTNFGAQWLAEEGEDYFELLTNYTKDGKYESMRNSYSGTLEECIAKAKRITSYYS